MDFQLTDEQRLISEAAREFADKEIAPRVKENDRAARFDIGGQADVAMHHVDA